MDKAKPFDIPKREVWEAFKKVKANQGAAGVYLEPILELRWSDISGMKFSNYKLLSALIYLLERVLVSNFFPQPFRPAHRRMP